MACPTITLGKTALYVGAGEANWIINVTAPSSICTWTATSDSDWLIVKSTSPAPPAGSGYVKVRAVANIEPSTRGPFPDWRSGVHGDAGSGRPMAERAGGIDGPE